MLIVKYCKQWKSMDTITDTGGRIWSLSWSWWGLHECVPLGKHMDWMLGTQHFSTLMWYFHKFTSLACCSPWGHKEPDTTEQLNWLIVNRHTKQCHVSYLDMNMWLSAWNHEETEAQVGHVSGWSLCAQEVVGTSQRSRSGVTQAQSSCWDA